MNVFTHGLAAMAALSLLLTPALPAFAADAPVKHVRGTLRHVSPTEITVTTTDGSVTVPIDGKTKVVGVVPSTPAEITSGAFIGTANVPGPTSTSARALEVVVFPESMAGTGEGDYPWDLASGKGHSTMTNGTVGTRRASMMTNATVTGVNNGATKTVTLQYKGGSKQVSIPPGTPVVRIVPGSSSLLTAGARIFAVPGKDGGAAPFVVVGEQGAVPPM